MKNAQAEKDDTLKHPIMKTTGLLVLFLFWGIAPRAMAQPFQQLAVGAAHICALDSAGKVECTATNISGRFLPPEDLPLMRQIVAGQQHTCGITLDDGVECWGEDAFGVLQVPAFDSPVVSIASGFNHTCALDANSQVQCWGLNNNDQLNAPNVAFVKLDASRTATCGIDTIGDVHCWSSDEFFNTDRPIAGPFVDLDTDSNAACGLTANGNIECWAIRERNNLSAPANGPYIDMTVTGSAICGLRSDQLLDCSFPDPVPSFIETFFEEYPLDVRFSSIERSNFQFGGVPICGIRADNGTISCFGGTGGTNELGLPPPPGSDPISAPLTASNVSLGLTAQVYGFNQVELFWNQILQVFPPIFVEVYRDGELLTTTSNSFSYYDNDSTVVSEESDYRVRTIDEAGNVGPFSNFIAVDRDAGTVLRYSDSDNPDNPRQENNLRIRDVSVSTFSPISDDTDSFILSWRTDNPSNTSVAGFEVRINGEVVGFQADTPFIGNGVDTERCRIYSVAAIAENGEILDFGSAVLGRLGFQCPR